jgi:hypothetical protein
MRQYRKSPARGLIRALLGLATLLVAASGFFAVQGALAGAGSAARATTTVPAPDPPPVKPKAKPKPPPPPPPPPVKQTVVVPPSPPPPPVTPPPPPPVVVAPPPPAPVKTTSHIHHKAHRRHRVHRRHAIVAPPVPRALMIRPAVAAPVTHVEAFSAAPLAASGPSPGGGGGAGLGALVATLLALSALLLLAATVPLHLLPIPLAEVLAPRRPDCATAGAIGLIAVAVAYLVAQA